MNPPVEIQALLVKALHFIADSGGASSKGREGAMAKAELQTRIKGHS